MRRSWKILGNTITPDDEAATTGEAQRGAEGLRLPLSHLYREVRRRAAARRSAPGYRGPEALQPPQGAGKHHRCRATPAPRSRKHPRMGLRMRLQMGLRMRSPRES